LKARQEIGYLEEGTVAITPGFLLPAKYIIHAVSPWYPEESWGIERNEIDEAKQLLRSCYDKSLLLALENQCKSIAFPLLGTGNLGFPRELGLEIALQSIQNFLLKEDMMVYLVLFDKESVRLSGQLYDDIEAYIDEHYVRAQARAEYGDIYRNIVGPPDVEERCAGASMDECLDFSVEAEKNWDEEATLPSSAAKSSAWGGVWERKMRSMPRAAAFEGTSRSLKDLVDNIGETFQQQLFRLIDERGRDDVSVYKGACKDKKLFHKIRKNVDYQPSKHTVYAFAISLQLSLDETKDLLATAGYAMSPSNKFDVIMRYFFERKIYDMYQIDCVLYDFGEDKNCFSCES